MTAIRIWSQQHRCGNLTKVEVLALLGETDLSEIGQAAALKRARDKLRATEMVILVWADPEAGAGEPVTSC
jgi:hypothetical protein